MCRIIQFFLGLVTLLLAESCSCDSSHPVLTRIDDLIQRGDYLAADSLWGYFHFTQECKSESDRMYYNLVKLERKFIPFELTEDDFSMADSLIRYYQDKSMGKLAMAQLFMGDIYHSGHDYPSAITCLLQALQNASTVENPILEIWINRHIGDIYFNQRMLPECISYYRKSFDIAFGVHDTLRMAHGAFSMARVSMINNDADSAIYYLRKAIEWSQGRPNSKSTSVPAMSVLADIYIQTEQYDKASSLMTRNSIDDENWAYWHLGQQHTDSAVYYFRKMIGKYNWSGDVTYLQILADLAEQRGNRVQAFEYYKKLSAAKDSLKEHSRIEETRQAKARHEYVLIKQQRDKAERDRRMANYLLLGLLVIVASATMACVMAWRAYLNKKEKKLLQKKLYLQVRDRRGSESTVQLLEQSALRERIKENAGKDTFHLTDDEWQTLASLIDQAYDQFTARLRMLYDDISEYELHICYLIKLGVSSTDIGTMLYKSKAAIGMARQRLYKKLIGSKGTARQLNDLIESF